LLIYLIAHSSAIVIEPNLLFEQSNQVLIGKTCHFDQSSITNANAYTQEGNRVNLFKTTSLKAE